MIIRNSVGIFYVHAFIFCW